MSSTRHLLAGVLGMLIATAPAPVAAANATIPAYHKHLADVPVALIHMRNNYPASKTSYCSGTPIAGTSTLLTAAHCFGKAGAVSHRATIIYQGRTYTGTTFKLHPKFVPGGATPQFDLALITIDGGRNARPVFGSDAARVGTASGAAVTVAGYQSSDDIARADRQTNPGVNHNGVTYWLRGCATVAPTIKLPDGSLRSKCGMRPGASGGPVLERRSGGWFVVGAVINLTDQGYNGWSSAAGYQAVNAAPAQNFFRG